MNDIWSRYIQGIKTLYHSRKLRFDDRFAEAYRTLFALDDSKPIKILEIGCGPGALAGALHRWYPHAELTAIDRDSEFIRFANEHEPGILFLEGDATALPFEAETFDVTISHTVSEHIKPSLFYGEQHRVLKPGGICIVLSSRRGITCRSACDAESAYEQEFWQKVEQYDDCMERYVVGKYAMSEAELPLAMARYGFSDLQTGFISIDLTPDHPNISADMAHAIFRDARDSALERIESVARALPERVTAEETEEMKRCIQRRYDTRVEFYERGEKHWDTTVSVLMAIRGVKIV